MFELQSFSILRQRCFKGGGPLLCSCFAARLHAPRGEGRRPSLIAHALCLLRNHFFWKTRPTFSGNAVPQPPCGSRPCRICHGKYTASAGALRSACLSFIRKWLTPLWACAANTWIEKLGYARSMCMHDLHIWVPKKTASVIIECPQRHIAITEFCDTTFRLQRPSRVDSTNIFLFAWIKCTNSISWYYFC